MKVHGLDCPHDFSTLGPSFVHQGSIYHITTRHGLKNSTHVAYENTCLGRIVYEDPLLDFVLISAYKYAEEPTFVELAGNVSRGDSLVKRGAMTGTTMGRISMVQRHHYHIFGGNGTAFAKCGDSGSSVINTLNQLFGIIIDGNERDTRVLSMSSIIKSLPLKPSVWLI